MSNDAFKKGLDDLDAGPGRTARQAPEYAPPAGGIPPHPSVDGARARFGEAIGRHELVAGDEHIIYIVPERSREVLQWLRDDPAHRYDFLQDLTAVDYGGGASLQVVYQLWSTVH